MHEGRLSFSILEVKKCNPLSWKQYNYLNKSVSDCSKNRLYKCKDTQFNA